MAGVYLASGKISSLGQVEKQASDNTRRSTDRKVYRAHWRERAADIIQTLNISMGKTGQMEDLTCKVSHLAIFKA